MFNLLQSWITHLSATYSAAKVWNGSQQNFRINSFIILQQHR